MQGFTIGRRGAIAAGLGAAAGVAAGGSAGAFERDGNRKILVFAGGQPVPVIDPHSRYDWSTRMIQQSIYDALAKYVNNPPQIVPWLAERWETSADQTVWTFHLVANAKFHNGDPVDAEAVRYSFERGLRMNKGVAWMLKDVLPPENIVAVDPRTVRFTLSRPMPSFLTFIPLWFIVNPKQVQAHVVNNDWGEAWLTGNPAGSGPFRVRRLEPQSVIHLDSVPEYWKGWPQGEQNRLSGVIYRIVREPAARRALLQRGEADIITEIPADDFEQLKGMRGIRPEDHKGLTTFAITMNTTKGPTADLNVRKAIAHAFDYDALIQIHNGAATLMTSPFPEVIPGYVAVPDMPRRNLDKAREFLAKSAHPQGGFELEYVHVQGLEDPRRIGLVLLNSLQALNIKVNIVAQPWPTMVARGAKAETAPDMVSVYVTPVAADPDVIAGKYHTRAQGNFWGMHHLTDPQISQWVDAARVEADETKRNALYAEIQKRVVELQPEIFGMLANRRWLMRDWVKGFSYCPLRLTGEVDLHPMWIDAR
ncbi:ABC transporter substrate-binding protein [Roseomonas sp. AR75]|uniref:ABC transporter substrate-binding protein n=1 Tax=Roseomonas sp. AR75 TaxID=2562311 RepID=UPI0010BF967E|nr:ABC transporter substrate-binding protein [Roseomonas sp. AR75]